MLPGEDAAGLSPTNISRLTAAWEQEYQAFRNRDLSACDSVCVWGDGIHFNVRLEDDRLCTLVMIGVRADGTKDWSCPGFVDTLCYTCGCRQRQV